MVPTIKSLTARFTKKKLKGVRSFFKGSTITESIMTELPHVITMHKMIEMIAVKYERGFGAHTSGKHAMFLLL